MTCRLCNDDCENEEPVELFDNEHETELVKLIAKYLYVKIKLSDPFSTRICRACSNLIEEFHQFFQLVAGTQKFLQKDPMSSSTSARNKFYKQDSKTSTTVCTEKDSFLISEVDESVYNQHSSTKIIENQSKNGTEQSRQSYLITELKFNMIEHFQKLERELKIQRRQLDRIATSMSATVKPQILKSDTAAECIDQDKNMKTIASSAISSYNMEEYENLSRIINSDGLIAFDKMLEDEMYFSGLVHYFESQLVLNGKRDANALFKVIFRRLVSAQAILGYSWKGNKRVSGGADLNVPNKSFQIDFPNFVKLFDALLTKADFEYRREKLDDYFSGFLRSKKKEAERELVLVKKNILPRAVTSRKRKRTTNFEPTDDQTQDVKPFLFTEL